MSAHTYTRFVALGDSQTEGLNDGSEAGGYRGWADRLAEKLAALNPELQYANLAVRGRRAGQIRSEQLEPALAMRPDLVTVVAGMNDMLRPKFDADQVSADIEAMFAALSAAGVRVATISFPDVGKVMPWARPLTGRVVALNARIARAAARHDVAVLDTFQVPVTTDTRFWSSDRLHGSPLGHERIAAAMARLLELPGSDDAWLDPLPALPKRTFVPVLTSELRWFATFLGPWIGRRIRGTSSGDGRSAKRPRLTPVRDHWFPESGH